MATDAPLLFYNKANGKWATGIVHRDGTYENKKVSTDEEKFGSWTHIVGSGTGSILFYNQPDGQYAVGSLNMDGEFLTHRTGTFAQWTHIVATGDKKRKAEDTVNPTDQPYLFYNKNTRQWATGVITPELKYEHGNEGGNFSEWSHIVGAGNGALLFYNKNTRQWATGAVTPELNYKHGDEGGNFNEWSHIVGNGNGSLLFYNSGNREAATGSLSPDGNYTNRTTSPPGSFGTWTNIANCGNGCLLLFNNANGQYTTGVLRLNSEFVYASGDDPNTFGKWTNVVGEAHRSRTQLRLIELTCNKTEDSGADHAYLDYNDDTVMDPTKINDGQPVTVNVKRVMVASTAKLDLYDQDDDPDPDDHLGTVIVSDAERGKGKRQAKFTGDDANYTLHYEVR